MRPSNRICRDTIVALQYLDDGAIMGPGDSSLRAGDPFLVEIHPERGDSAEHAPNI